MKHKYSQVQKYGLLFLFIIILFVINPFFENKYRDAEKNVQIFKKEHSEEYDSIRREYDTQFELIMFRNDSSKNVIKQKYTILRHELKMQKLKKNISDDDFNDQYHGILKLEIAEISMVKDTFYESFTRLDRPEEIKVPHYLLNNEKLFGGLDALIRFVKWILLVVAVIFICLEYFDNKKIEDKEVIPSNITKQTQFQKQQLSDELVNKSTTIDGKVFTKLSENDKQVGVQEIQPDAYGNYSLVPNTGKLLERDEFDSHVADQVQQRAENK